jgi:predicted XRE-type DNA-binding protein
MKNKDPGRPSRIEELRREALGLRKSKMSQGEIAAKLGRTAPTISDFERGIYDDVSLGRFLAYLQAVDPALTLKIVRDE